MTWIYFCAVLCAAFYVTYGCVPDNEVFIVKLMNVTVKEGENTSFACRAHPNLTAFNYEWQYTIFGESSPIVFDLINNPFNLRADSDGNGGVILQLPFVSPQLNGARFRCAITDQRRDISLMNQICSMPAVGARIPTYGFIYVEAPPMISQLESSYSVATLNNITIGATISSNPKPTVTLYHVAQDGTETLLSGDSQSSVSISEAGGNQYDITFRDVRRSDEGNYTIVVNNGILPNAIKMFRLVVVGVDPPVVTVSPSQKVAHYNQDVTFWCEVQRDGYNSSTTIEWMDPTNNTLSSTSGDVRIQDYSNGTVSLTLKLTPQRTGMYSCRATDGRIPDSKSVDVFGPPPSPVPADIEVMDAVSPSVTIQWNRPQQSTIITQYRVTIYSASGTMEKLTKTYPTDHTVGSITLDLNPGEYEFTITALSNDVVGTESMRRPLSVVAPFQLTIVIGAAVGAFVFIVFLLVLAILVFCCCYKYYVRRKENSSHQQWNSDEEKVPGHHTHVPAVMNSYTTALALNSHSDLPPSPMSPMTSAMGIDPKWEFPRENVTLQDELAVGQFTVLYKATARGLRDNRLCDVTVKSLRDGATEDDLKVLIYEMDMLATIEDHPNIVSLLRVCSVGKPLYMVMEYMCHGDLLGFLRSCRGHRGMYTVSPGPRYQPPALQLCSRDLLNMATKIASGMRFLADRKIVHRALCAKNILVGTGMDVKIYNVGSFDYPIDTGDDLTKWMAPETLFDGTNTTYSDVWSFGVTMWELVTVGGTPYADIPAEELYHQLQSGMRMVCPAHCTQEVYDIMIACWQKNPVDRPHFAIIHENLDELVTSKVSYLDLKSYDSQAYSHFDKSLPKSTPL